MKEYERLLHRDDFEGGLSARLHIGELAVNQIVALRMEYPDVTHDIQLTKYAQFIMRIVFISPHEDGSAILVLSPDLDPESDDTQLNKEVIGSDALILREFNHEPYRLYLADQTPPEWSSAEVKDLLRPSDT